jgi:hypothetical protein
MKGGCVLKLQNLICIQTNGSVVGKKLSHGLLIHSNVPDRFLCNKYENTLQLQKHIHDK